jgi:hypothetical protein
MHVMQRVNQRSANDRAAATVAVTRASVVGNLTFRLIDILLLFVEFAEANGYLVEIANPIKRV